MFWCLPSCFQKMVAAILLFIFSKISGFLAKTLWQACQWFQTEYFIITSKDIRITCPCDLYPLASYFYIVKFGFTGVYKIFLFLL